MLAERVTVAARDANYLWVEARRKNHCRQCEAGHGCGAGLALNLLSPKTNLLKLPRPAGAAECPVGHELTLVMPARRVMNLALLAYLAPLLLMLLMTLLVSWPRAFAVLGEGWTILAALAGLLAGLAMARIAGGIAGGIDGGIAGKEHGRFLPEIQESISQPSPPISRDHP